MICPINKLEEIILKNSEIKQGLGYGEPRKGHPEGLVKNHVIEIFGKIDLCDYPPRVRDKLRIIGIFHDSLKFRVDESKPKVDCNNHGVLARKVAEEYIFDQNILNIIELHDAYYYMWKKLIEEGKCIDADFNRLINRINGGMELYVKFMLIDGTTGDKDIRPRIWFYEKLLDSGYLESIKPAQF